MLKRRHAVLAVLATTAASVFVLPVSPASALSVDNACRNSVTANNNQITVDTNGTDSPDPVVPGGTVTLSNITQTANVPGTIFVAGYNLGLLVEGENTVPATVATFIEGTSTKEGVQQTNFAPTSITFTIDDPDDIPGSGDETATPGTLNATYTDQTWTQGPNANAGPDQTVNSGASVSLNGAGSLASGSTIEFREDSRYPLVPSPQGSEVGGIVIRAVVGFLNVRFACSPGTVTPPETPGIVNPIDPAPSFASTTISPAVSQPLTYAWTQTGGPAAPLTGANSATPSFTAPTGPASLTFQLQVCEGTVCDTDTVVVNVRPQITINDVSLAEGNSGQTAFNFTVSLSGAATANVTVQVATADVTATAPGDYTAIGPPAQTLTFTPGQTSQTVTVQVNGDTAVEPNETFNVNLSGASANATIADSQGLGTIVNDDAVASDISINDASATEGGAVEFTVSLSGPQAAPVTVDYATANGSAVAPGDYTSATGTVTFAPGQTSQTVTVQTIDDALVEGTETFDVNLSNAGGNAAILDGLGVGTILDNDVAEPQRQISINDVSVAEGNSGQTPAQFTVSLDAASANPITVEYATADGTATAPGDYTANSGTVTFAPGDTSETVTVQVNGDALVEPNETFDVNLSNATGNATILDGTGVGTITNDDVAGSSISISNSSASEGGAVQFTVSLSAPQAAPVTVNYATANGSAVAPGDYTAATGTVTFAPGDISEPVSVTTIDDADIEGPETFNVNLSGATGNATIADGLGVGTINDNDGTSVPNACSNTLSTNFTQINVITAGDDGLTTVAAGGATTTSNLTQSAAIPGAVFLAGYNLGVLQAGPNNIAVNVQTKIEATNTVEGTQTTNTAGGTPPDGSVFVTTVITDTDGIPNGIGESATDASFSVNYDDLNWTAGASGTIEYRQGSIGTAPPTLANNTLLINASIPGFPLPISFRCAPGTVAPPAPGTITLINPADSFDTTQIQAAEPQRQISINNASATEGGAVEFTVSLDQPSANPVTVEFATGNGSAVAPGDYTANSGTVTFTPGQTSQTVTVQTIDDALVEGTETFDVNLSNAGGNAAIADGLGVGTILDNDVAEPQRQISINDVSVAEGNSGQTPAQFTVSLDAASANPITVEYATADGTATAPGDYTANSGTVTFTPGQTSQTVTVQVNGDALVEGTETFDVNLSNATGNAAIADGLGVGTILDNDVAGSSISISNSSASEGGAVQFTVSLSAPQAAPVTVNYATANGSAVAPGDYTAATGTVTFAPGDTSEPVSVTTIDDADIEGPETFNVNLSGATGNATIADGLGVGTINDNDGTSVPNACSNTLSTNFTQINVITAGDDGLTTVAAGGATTTSNLTQSAAIPGAVFLAGYNLGVLQAGPNNIAVNVQTKIEATNTVEGTQTTNTAGGTPPDGSVFVTTVITDTDGIPNGIGESATDASFSVNYDDLNWTAGASGTIEYRQESIGTAPPTLANNTLLINASIPGFPLPISFRCAPGTVAPPAPGTITLINPADSFDTTQIQAAEPQRQISINNASATEGGAVEFTVSLDQPSANPVTVDYATTNNTAVAPGDYTAATGTVTFAPGDTSKTVTVQTIDDTDVEGLETFAVNLSNAGGNAAILDGIGVGTILDNDVAEPQRQISINNASATEGGAVEFTVSLDQPSANPVTVDYATANNTAVAPGDYTAATGTVTFAPGDTSKTVTVQTIDDTDVEGLETFAVNLTNAGGNAAILDGIGVGTILDNDVAEPQRQISINNASATEGGAVEFTVSLDQPSANPVTVDYATANNTAVAPGDYTAATGTVTFAPGDTSKTVTVQTIDDTDVEGLETFVVNLSNAGGNAAILDATGVGTILDNDVAEPQRKISINDVTKAEGNSGQTPFQFTVSLDAPSANPVTVDYATANGTAVAPGDYTSATGTVTFAPGDTSETVTVQVNGDTAVEPNETFNVNLSNATGNAAILDGTGVGTITNDDAVVGKSKISINDVTKAEGNSGQTPFQFTVSLSAPQAAPVTVKFATANGTATAPSDYASSSGTVTFAPGETSKTVTVQVNGDTAVEPNETFKVNLSNATGNATILDGQGVGTITNDDAVAGVDAAAKVLVAGKVFDLGKKDFMPYVIKVTNVGTSRITVNSRTDISTQVKVNGTVNGSVAVLPLTWSLNPGQSALIPVLWTGNVRPGDSVQFIGCVNLAGDTNTANNCDSVTLIASALPHH